MRLTRVLLALVMIACLTTGPARPAPPVERGPAPRDVGELVRKLGSPSYAEREAAQAALARLGPGARGPLEDGARATDPEVVRRAKALLEELRLAARASAEVHVVGLYESRRTKAVVEVRAADRPVILVLCAYEPVTWEVRPAPGARLVEVIAAGYHAQRVEGAGVPVTTYSYDERSRAPDGKPLYFYTYDHDEEKYPNMAARVKDLTGKRVTSFRGRYGFKRVPFVVPPEE
jgi:hypothetical protein